MFAMNPGKGQIENKKFTARDYHVPCIETPFFELRLLDFYRN